jgi:hypothetical protein
MIRFITKNTFTQYFSFSTRSSIDTDAHIHEDTPMNVRIHTLSLWALPEDWVRLTNHEIEEVTIYALLSPDMSPTTKRIALLNSEINLEKYEYLYQVEYLKPRLSRSTIRNPWTFLFKIIYFINCYCHTRDCANALVDLYISYICDEK